MLVTLARDITFGSFYNLFTSSSHKVQNNNSNTSTSGNGGRSSGSLYDPGELARLNYVNYWVMLELYFIIFDKHCLRVYKLKQ